jgi:hypothetical protein
METSDDYVEAVERERDRLLEDQRVALINVQSILHIVMQMSRAQSAMALEYVTKVNNTRTS